MFGLAGSIAVSGALADDQPDAVSAEQLSAIVGQIMILEFNVGADRYRTEKGGDHRQAIADMTDLVAEFGLGGFVAEEHNDALYLDPGFAAVREAAAIDGLRPFVSVNEEGGAVQIPSNRWYDHAADWIGCTSLGPIPGYTAKNPTPSAGWKCPDHGWADDVHYLPYLRNAHLMGSQWTEAETETHGQDIGRVLAGLNITMNLAPVLGVSDGTKHTSFLGDRTFANDPAKVALWAAAFSRGVRSGSGGQVVTVLKHFPGLGSATANTDEKPAWTPPLADLERRDLVPYETPIAARYEAVGMMMSNAIVPGLTCAVSDKECRTPATLSPAAYRLLREKYGWDGLVMTDTLQTAAVLGGARTLPEAAVAAVAAGTDMVLVKPAAGDLSLDGYRRALTAVGNAMTAWVAAKPEARRARLAQSLTRIKAAKATIDDTRPR